jgi:hypothetical protein
MVYLTILIRAMYKARVKYHKIVRCKQENSEKNMTYYNSTDTCKRIKEDGNRCKKDFHGKAYTEKDKNGLEKLKELYKIGQEE